MNNTFGIAIFMLIIFSQGNDNYQTNRMQRPIWYNDHHHDCIVSRHFHRVVSRFRVQKIIDGLDVRKVPNPILIPLVLVHRLDSRRLGLELHLRNACDHYCAGREDLTISNYSIAQDVAKL